MVFMCLCSGAVNTNTVLAADTNTALVAADTNTAQGRSTAPVKTNTALETNTGIHKSINQKVLTSRRSWARGHQASRRSRHKNT